MIDISWGNMAPLNSATAKDCKGLEHPSPLLSAL